MSSVPPSTIAGVAALMLTLSSVKVSATTDQTSSLGPARGAQITKNIPAKVNILGMKFESLSPITQQAAPMEARTLPKIVQHGGFESVYAAAGKKYGVPWQILAAVHMVETGQSDDTDRVSSAGAVGPMQFMPGTFERYAQDGDGDGVASITDVHDAIFTAAKMLAANGAGTGNLRGALFNYNHSYEYVEKVLAYAASLGY
jgi:soluble lytic murein transglycosylase-like protein